MMCKWDEAFTVNEMLEETGRCKDCKLNCENAGKVKNKEKDEWMDAHCPWYLGRWKVSNNCDKTCPITAENRDTSICPECYNDDFD